jgi:protease-4
MAEELRRFRMESGKPVIACLMDVATAGAYYLAIEADWIVAHPTTLTGAIGALFNHYNLQDAMAQLNVVYDPIKSGEHVNMGSVAEPLSETTRKLLEKIVLGYLQRFLERLAQRRPAIRNEDRMKLADGRVVAAPEALSLGLVDQIGYLHDAIAEAKQRGRLSDAEVVVYQRAGSPARSLYAVAPNTPMQSELIPLSYPGLDRSKLPTFLYLWQPDPTILRQGGR